MTVNQGMTNNTLYKTIHYTVRSDSSRTPCPYGMMATDHTLYPEDTIEGKASEYYIAITELEKLPKE